MAELDIQKLRHDIKNDIGALESIAKMLGDSRDDVEFSSELIVKLASRCRQTKENVLKLVSVVEQYAPVGEHL